MSSHETSKPLAYSIREACAITSLGKTTIYRLARLGSIRLVRVGGRTIVPADSLHALLGGSN